MIHDFPGPAPSLINCVETRGYQQNSNQAMHNSEAPTPVHFLQWPETV